MVIASDLGPEGRASEPRCTHAVFFGKTLNSHGASLHPSVYMGTTKLVGDNLTKCWKVTVIFFVESQRKRT